MASCATTSTACGNSHGVTFFTKDLMLLADVGRSICQRNTAIVFDALASAAQPNKHVPLL
jgi:hypothetical protein